METKKVGAAVGVLIKKENQILLGKRNSNAPSGDEWCCPGGKIDFGETFEEAAIRETKEEAGIILNKVEVFCIVNDMTESHHYADIGLYSDNFEGDPHPASTREIVEWKWFDIDNLPRSLFEPSRFMIENYIASKFYIPKTS